MVKSKTFQGRAPEEVLNELASIKDLLLDIDANIEALLIAKPTEGRNEPVPELPASASTYAKQDRQHNAPNRDRNGHRNA